MWLRTRRQPVGLMRRHECMLILLMRLRPERIGCVMRSAKVFEAEAKKQPSVRAMMDEMVRCL